MSRSMADLHPDVRVKVEKWVAACATRGVDILVYCTLRTADEQAALYAMGRTAPGKIVTNAKPWQSWHQFGRAVDAVPMVNGKPDWSYSDLDADRWPDEPWWQIYVVEAGRAGLEWAGNWTTFREFVHVQDTGGLTLGQAMELRG